MSVRLSGFDGSDGCLHKVPMSCYDTCPPLQVFHIVRVLLRKHKEAALKLISLHAPGATGGLAQVKLSFESPTPSTWNRRMCTYIASRQIIPVDTSLAHMGARRCLTIGHCGDARSHSVALYS